jgi:hypothetical protein
MVAIEIPFSRKRLERVFIIPRKKCFFRGFPNVVEEHILNIRNGTDFREKMKFYGTVKITEQNDYKLSHGLFKHSHSIYKHSYGLYLPSHGLYKHSHASKSSLEACSVQAFSDGTCKKSHILNTLYIFFSALSWT